MNFKYIFFLLLVLNILINDISAQVVNINNGVHFVADGTISIVVDNGGIKNDGIFIPDSSTVTFSGSPAISISGSQPITFFNVLFNGTGSKVNNGDASVLQTLAVGGTTVLDADGATNDRPFTLKSSDTATARVDILTTGNIIGNVTVERFINTGTGTGEHGKSWQFLATPTTGQTYFQSWQEGGAIPTGYGTWITGTGSGFDATSAIPSLKFYNSATGLWTAVTNTGLPLQNRLGYMLFVRGDRTVTTFNGTPNNTNMRSKGVLFTPSNPPLSVPVAANQYQTFGNPYASRIEFNKVYTASTGINDVYYAWDPKLAGSYNLGGYQTMSGITGYIPTAGNNTSYYPSATPAPYIESGQAVFVIGNGTGGNVNFNENVKVAGSRLVHKGPVEEENSFPPGRQFLFTTLFTNSGIIADGNIVAFENGLGNNYNINDAPKIMNDGENLAIIREHNILAVEARDEININDTIFYYLKNLRQQQYQLRFAPVNIISAMTGILIDRYQNVSRAVSLTDSTFIDFTIDANPLSNDPGRFIVVFKETTVVPVKFISIAASRINDNTNQVFWKVGNELNIEKYIVERSADGASFYEIGITSPLYNNGSTASYNLRDEAPLLRINYYRIKAISLNGFIQYSNIVQVSPLNDPSSITIYPNPVKDRTIHLYVKNILTGTYNVKLTNSIGQIMYSNILNIDQSNGSYTINTGAIAAGTYHISITDKNRLMHEQVIILSH